MFSEYTTNDYPLTEPEVSDVTTTEDKLKDFQFDDAIKAFALMEMKAKADTADLQKKLIMQQFRPCKLYPVIIYHDGMRWVCCYGVFNPKYKEYLPENALGQSGAEAYGITPEDAMKNFDSMWLGLDDVDND